MKWVASANKAGAQVAYYLHVGHMTIHVESWEDGWHYRCPEIDLGWMHAEAISVHGVQREAVRAVVRLIRQLSREADLLWEKFGKAKSIKELEAEK